jgi:hypothetical protein
MKHVPLLVALVLVVAACNLTSRFKTTNNSNSAAPTTAGNKSAPDGEPVEKPHPTAAQTAAIANGADVKWDQQGISWTVPASWKKQDVRNESLSYAGSGAFLIANISTMGADFPADLSIKAMHEGAKTEQKNGKYDEVKWLAIDDLRGVEFRQSKQERPDDIRRLEWQGYRVYAGQSQLVTIILSTNDANFSNREDELNGILYSTKIVH